MDDLLSVMQIIDRNSEKFAEGDYLEVCNLLKKAYNKRSDPVFFFDYENFGIPPTQESEYVYRYFNDFYFDKALNLDSDFLQGQINYLQKELMEYQPIRRASKYVKESVEQHYFMLYGRSIDEIDETVKKQALKSLCASYITIENNFRQKYREAIEKKLEWLEQADDRLDEV